MFAEEGEWLTLEPGQKKLFCVESGSGELYIRRGASETCDKLFAMELSAGQFVICAKEGSRISLVVNVIERMEYKFISYSELMHYPFDKVKKFLFDLMGHDGVIPDPKNCGTVVLRREVEVREGESLLAPYGEVFFLELSEEAEIMVSERLLLPERVVVLGCEGAITFTQSGKYRAYSFEEFVEKYSLELVWRLLVNEGEMFVNRMEKYFSDREQYFNDRYDKWQNAKKQSAERFTQRIFGWVSNSSLPGVDAGDLPIITALQQIAARLGIDKSKITIPGSLNRKSPQKEILRQLLAGNDLYGRQVKLENKWWTMDIGPLLVFRDEEPYAAIPLNPKSYVLVDYKTGEYLPIDATLAGEIDEEAYVFFRKIPEKLNTLGDWFQWAFKLCWGNDYFVIAISCLIVGILPLVVPLITNTVFADIIPAYESQALFVVVQVMLVALSAQAFTTLVRDIAVLRVKNSIRLSIEPALWIKLLDLPSAFFRKYTVGDLSNRMSGISTVASQFSSIVSSGLFNGLFGFFNLLVMAYFSIKLTGITCIVWFLYLILAVFFIVRLKKFQEKHLKLNGEVSGTLVQILSGLNVFKIQNAEDRAMNFWAEDFGESWKYNRKQRWQNNYLSILNQIQPLILNGLIFYFSISFIDEAMKGGSVSPLSTADFLSFFSAMGSFGTAVSGVVSGGMGMMSLMPILERLKPIIEEEPETSSDKLPAPELAGSVELSRVSFRYQPDLPMVLHDINLHIDKGSFVAIAGSSGCGKSTLLRLILGLERPSAGLIEFDGLDLSQLDISSVRRQLGVVVQHGRLMAGTIMQNIVGALPLTIDDAWEAAENVGLAADIRQMPMGMHTYISEDGGNISGGQKQRILIARAIVNHARIIVFDEATSSLDNETQHIVSETIERLQATRIVVAHRLSTIRNADKIVVLDDGRIVEEGNYDELMALNGYFTQLANRQIL